MTDNEQLIAEARFHMKDADRGVYIGKAMGATLRDMLGKTVDALEATTRERDEAEVKLAIFEVFREEMRGFHGTATAPETLSEMLDYILDADPTPAPVEAGEREALIESIAGGTISADERDRYISLSYEDAERIVDTILDEQARRAPIEDAENVMGDTGIIYVCAACGVPTESEPCAEHQPRAYARMGGIEDAEPVAYEYRDGDGTYGIVRAESALMYVIRREYNLTPLYRAPQPAKPIEVSDKAILVALNTYYGVDYTQAQHGEQDPLDMRAAIEAALKETGR